MAAAEALNRQRTQHATLRIAIIAGSGAGTIIGVAFAVAHSRRPRYLPPPKVLNGYDYRRLEDWGGGND